MPSRNLGNALDYYLNSSWQRIFHGGCRAKSFKSAEAVLDQPGKTPKRWIGPALDVFEHHARWQRQGDTVQHQGW